MNCYILRYSEIGLKSHQTRNRWLNVLRQNIKDCLFWNGISDGDVKIVQGRLILYLEDADAAEALRHLFGIASFSPAKELKLDINLIKKEAIELYKEKRPRTFRVTTQRVTKDFVMTSIQVNSCIGEAVCEFGGKVSLRKYDLNIGIEIINEKAYIFSETYKGPGGLPLGVQNQCCAIIKNFRDFISGLLCMKRGCRIDLIIYDSPLASSFIDILQNYAFRGLEILLIKNDWDLHNALKAYMDKGIEVFISGKPLITEHEIVNMCPCELYTDDLLFTVIAKLGIELPVSHRNHMISAGGIVYYKGTVLLLRRKDEKTWVLPKGGVDNLEFFRVAAEREICEEASMCNLEVGDFVGKTRYKFNHGGVEITKDVYYYFCISKKNHVRLEYLFDSYTFLTSPEAIKLLTFENDRKMVRSAERLRQHMKENVHIEL